MKIVIQSNCGPYGLTRRALEAVSAVLPARIVERIDQLVVVKERWGPEPFEYDRKRRVVYFAYPGDSNRKEVREGALREFLFGCARLEAGGRFQVAMTDRQRKAFSEPVDRWYPACWKVINGEDV
jgi:hypothetical protein